MLCLGRTVGLACAVAGAFVAAAGCGNGVSPGSGALSEPTLTTNVVPMHALRPNHRKSWIAPDTKDERRLLFASDSGLEEVDIYSLPSMKLKGQLTGFSEPQGMCSDSGGNVYVADTSATEVDKYARTGSLLARYPDNYGLPVGCAVDPATGNVAVTDLVSGASGPGQVLVFSSPSSQPKILDNPSQYFYYFAGYGPRSSLWVSGRNASGEYILSRCSASSCATVRLSGGTLYFPGAVEWDNRNGTWVVFDQLCNDTAAACSYPVSARGVLGPPTTYTNYEGGNDCDLVQGEIFDRDRYVVGGDYEYCGGTSSTFNRWEYMTGGPTNYTVLSSSYSIPNGVAVSIK